jgi:hypothetical protein
MEKATTSEEKTAVYKDMDMTYSPLVVLPPLSEITVMIILQKNGQTWMKIKLSDNREGFIPSTTKLFIIREMVIEDDRGANIYESPSVESHLKKHLEKGSLLYLLGRVPNAYNAWVKVKDYSGSEGFMIGDVLGKIHLKGNEGHHNTPKCLNCGNIAPWKVEPMFRLIDWVIFGILLGAFGSGFIYLLIVWISRINPANRTKICSLCGAKNMFTFLY